MGEESDPVRHKKGKNPNRQRRSVEESNTRFRTAGLPAKYVLQCIALDISLKWDCLSLIEKANVSK